MTKSVDTSLIKTDSLPTLDKAYANIRREIARRGIMTGASSSGTSPSKIESGLIAKHRSDFTSFRQETVDKSQLTCDHCGGYRHTKKECFKLIGYPYWLEESKQQKAAVKAPVTQTGGKAQVVTTLPQPMTTVQPEEAHDEKGQGMSFGLFWMSHSKLRNHHK